MRGGARVVRGGREGFVDTTGAGGVGLGDTGFAAERLRVTGFSEGGLGEMGFGGGECLLVDVGVSKDATFPGDVLLVRIFANFSANSVVRPS